MSLPAEFARISRYFRPLAGPGALDLSDDAAVFLPPAGRELVISADAMVEAVHFLADDPPDLIARKLLRTNLSDLAAMGARPLAYLITVSTRKDTPESWYVGFAAGLAQDQAEYGLHLLGGDTTSTPGPISLSLTILGTVAPGMAIRRSGARPGDEIWVSGTIGDGALGLLAATGRLADPGGVLADPGGVLADPGGVLADRYRLPRPRLGLATLPMVRACMDVSDGLVQDLGHICRASNVAAEIEAALLPVSPAGRDRLALCLTGGDDYELLMAIRPADAPELLAHAAALGVAVTRIGCFSSGPAEVLVRDPTGARMELGAGGWSHFA